MITRLFKNFNKRINSTKRPLLDSGLVVECYLKEDTSLENPIFIIDRLAIGDESSQENWLDGYNYMYSNNHYYFIDDIIFRSDFHIEVHCHQDILATYRTDLGNLETLIERSSYEYDNMLADSMIIPKANIINSNRATTNVYSIFGTYLVRVMTQGGILGLVMSKTELNNLTHYIATRPDISEMMSTSSGEEYEVVGDALTGAAHLVPTEQKGMADIQQALTVASYNPGDYIKSVMYFPISISSGARVPLNIGIAVGGGIATIPWYNVLGDEGVNLDIGSLNIPNGYYNDWRDYDGAWTTSSIFLPGVGSLSINPSLLRRGLSASVSIDYLTGGALYKIYSNGALIMTASGQVGVEVQWGTTSPNYSATIIENNRHMMSMIGGIFGAGNTINTASSGSLTRGGVLSAGSAGMGLINESNQHSINMATIQANPTQSMVGGVGNASAIRFNPSIIVSIEQSNASNNANDVSGRPLYKTRKISNIPGFVKCVNASINVDGFMSDKVTLNSYLNGGFYYE